eukprot:403607_1
MDTFSYCDIYIVGQNRYGQFGLNHRNHVDQLTKWANPRNIMKIQCGRTYFIYCDAQQNYFGAGFNEFGQLGLGHFNSTVLELEPIPPSIYKIDKLFTSISGSSTFWKTSNGKIYGNGYNANYNLGIGDRANRNKPTLIPQLQNVIDIQIGSTYTLALCADVNNMEYDKIIIHWNEYKTPKEIRNLIKIYVGKYGKVYSTDYSWYGENGHGKYQELAFGDGKWHQINRLKNIKISKIATGFNSSLFLSTNGTLYCCGDNKAFGQLGLGEDIKKISIPTPIQYFIDNDIKIIDIAVGLHCLALDYNQNIYSFGPNNHCQCGHKRGIQRCFKPKLIKFFKPYKIIHIACGRLHSLAVTSKGQYFLFGHNGHNQCLIESKNDDPVLVNELISNKYPYKSIQQIILADCETILVLRKD